MADSNSKSIVIAITGGRDYTPTEPEMWQFENLLSYIVQSCPRNLLLPSTVDIVHGNARGVDTFVAGYCRRRPLEWTLWVMRAPIACPIDPALDGTDSRYMGFNRNERMLATYRPVALIAFPGGRGTEDCIRRAKKKGIKVYYAGQV